MSDIKVGDLVVVVRNPHGEDSCTCRMGAGLGKIFKVASISVTKSKCPDCGVIFPPLLCAWVEGDFLVFETYRLKRIPPLEELDDVKRDEEITA